MTQSLTPKFQACTVPGEGKSYEYIRLEREGKSYKYDVTLSMGRGVHIMFPSRSREAVDFASL